MLSSFAAVLLLAQAPAVEAPAATGAKTWVGRNAEFEEFLKTAPIERITDIPVGVTKPRHAFFKPGGLAGGAAVKNLPPGQRSGYWESYKSEIAAYELDKLLSLDMVPPTVERRIDSDLQSVQFWAEGCKLLKDLKGKAAPAPEMERWNRQVRRHRVFDNLIANIDRNAGNLLVDPEWNLILIDHSRAFTSTINLPFDKEMTRIDRPLFEKLQALDEATLREHVGKWIHGGDVKSILKRRDKIVQKLQKLAAEKGEAAVFGP